MYDYSFDAGSAALGGLVVGFAIFMVICIILCAVLSVLKIIGTWKILTKANEQGWKALIPIYNQYMLCKITGVNPWWILIVCLSPILSIIPFVGSLAVSAVGIYFAILLNISLARSFKKDDGFAVGLILLSPVFYFILGIKKDEYQGPKPMKDIIFKNETDNSKVQNMNVKYCSNCGKQISIDAKFCPECGKELQ